VRFDELPGSLADGTWDRTTAECLSDAELAALTESADSGRCLDHVSGCEWCGARLKALLAAQNPVVDIEEAELLADIAGGNQPNRRPARLRTVWGAVAALVALTAGATFWWQRYTDPLRQVGQLMARAGAADRPFDFRAGEWAWVERDLRRGATEQRPVPLLEAEAILAREGAAHPADPAWLSLRAQAEMLEFHFPAAIDLLRKAMELGPRSPLVLTDLCVAYSLDGDRRNQPSQYAAAIDAATRALAADPNYARALFNRALAFERLHMVDRAAADWEAYLTKEKNSAWAAEARRRLAELRRVQRQRARAMESDQDTDAVLDSRAVEWLATDRRRAAEAGERLLAQRGEPWLREAAREPVSSQALAKAVAAVGSGEADRALALSLDAAAFYQRQNAPAHAARARLEEVTALNRSMRAGPCRAASKELAAQADARGYRWIRVQAILQGGVCSGMQGELGEADRARTQALELARAYRLDGLELRAIGILAAARTTAGDLWAAWESNRDALGRLSGSPYPPARLQQCIGTYALSAELWGWDAAAYEFMRASADTLRATPNRITEGAVRARAAALAQSAGLPREASLEAATAEALLMSLPDSVTRTRYLDSVRIVQAEANLASGKAGAAVAALQPLVHAAVLQREQWRIHQLLGLGLDRIGRRTEAGAQLRQAVEDVRRAPLPSPGRSSARRRGAMAPTRTAHLRPRSSTPNRLSRRCACGCAPTVPQALRTWSGWRSTTGMPSGAMPAPGSSGSPSTGGVSGRRLRD